MSIGTAKELNREISNILLKKSQFNFIEQVIKSGLRISELDQKQLLELRAYLLEATDNKSKLKADQFTRLVRLFEVLHLPLKTIEAQYVIAGMDSMDCVIRAPQFWEVFVSYAVLTASLAGFDNKHTEQSILQHCKYHGVLESIAKNLPHGTSFSERYESINALSSKLASVDVYVSKIEEELRKARSLKEYLGLIKNLKTLQLTVKKVISESESKPFIECLEGCSTEIIGMKSKAEISIYSALLQEPQIQQILLNPKNKQELLNASKVQISESNNDTSLVDTLYRTLALSSIRKELKEITGTIDSASIMKIISAAILIKQREGRITARFSQETPNLGSLCAAPAA